MTGDCIPLRLIARALSATLPVPHQMLFVLVPAEAQIGNRIFMRNNDCYLSPLQAATSECQPPSHLPALPLTVK